MPHAAIRAHLLRFVESQGADLSRYTPPEAPSLSALRRSEWSDAFEQAMRNRLIIGALRYGLIGARGKPVYDRLGGIQKRLSQYRLSGNRECLVDIANLALLEFVEGKHPRAHFRALNGDHTCA
jgi:hypothetical protein